MIDGGQMTRTEKYVMDFIYMISSSSSEILNHCPIMITDMAYNATYQFIQFEGADIMQVIESFLFGMLANSIKFRDIYVRISNQIASSTKPINYAFLVEYVAKFAKSVIFFDNLYANRTKLRSSFDQMT